LDVKKPLRDYLTMAFVYRSVPFEYLIRVSL